MGGGSACCRHCRGCCPFLSCLGPGCQLCLRSSTPLDHANESASRQSLEIALPQSDAITPVEDEVSTALHSAVQPAFTPLAAEEPHERGEITALHSAVQPAFTPLAAEEPHERGEITLALLDIMIPFIENKMNNCLGPAEGSSSSPQVLGNMLSQWDKHKQIYTSIMNSLPTSLQDEAAKKSKALLMPLLKQALGSMGAVHCLGIAFAFISWSLDSLSNMSQNKEDCIDILQRSLRLLKLTKEGLGNINSHTIGPAAEDCLRHLVERVCRCVVYCASGLQDTLILRFLTANTLKDAVATLRSELAEAESQYNAVINTLNLQNRRPVERQCTFASTRDDIVGGLAKRVIDDVLAFLRDSTVDIKVALLHGMGGIGKSTLALQIFTEFQKGHTHRDCRVELPLDTSNKDLCDMQRQIVEKVGERKIKISNLTDGKKEIITSLLQIKDPIFLYVDNVMEYQHLWQSLPELKFFPNGSRILITSRNKLSGLHLGNRCTNISYNTFEVRKLQLEEARDLLWKQLKMNEEYMNMSGINIEVEEEQVLFLCDGLPLALVIVGKYIALAEDVEKVNTWRTVVECMKNAVPLYGAKKDDLYLRIGFSIHELDKYIKEVFLDVIFFLDIRQYAGKIVKWEKVERLVNPQYLNILHHRGLVLKGGIRNDCIEIHDVFKALGRRMMKNHEKELRIVATKQLTVIQPIDGIVALHMEEGELDLNLLTHMRGLRLLSNVIVAGESEKAIELKELRVVKNLQSSGSIDWSNCASLKDIHWRNCHNLKVFQLDNLPMGLEALQLQSWNGLKDMKVWQTLTCLKELQLRKCLAIQFLPDEVGKLTSLKHLELSQCDNLQSLPNGLASLTGLIELKLWKCISLQSLPDGLASLTSLMKLDLSYCKRLQSLPDGLVSLTCLEELDLSWCESLQSLPDGLASLTSLMKLDLSYCKRLQSLPDGLVSLTCLEELDLSWCESLQSLPDGLASLTSLMKLDLSYCKRLQSLPDGLVSLTCLEELDLSSCKSLQYLPEGLASLTRLTKLSLSSCTSLQSLPDGLGSLTGLTKLNVSFCESLQFLPDGLASLTGLTQLDLICCESLQSLPDGIGNLTGLTQLRLGGCNRLQSLPDGLASLTGLTELHLGFCESLQSLPSGLVSLTRLTQLDLSLTASTKLNLRGCKSLHCLSDGLMSWKYLRKLNLGWCRFQSLPDELASLTCLTQLNLSYCRSLQSLPYELVSLTGLTELDLRSCESLQFLPDGLASLTGLTKLHLSRCGSLQSLPDGLAILTGLTELDLSKCGSLQFLPNGLASLTGLTKLDLSGCGSLQSLPDGLGSLTGLTELDLSECGSLQFLPNGLASLTSLQKLNLSGCNNLQYQLDGLASLTCLSELGLSSCESLQCLLDGLSSLTSLTKLCINRFDKS